MRAVPTRVEVPPKTLARALPGTAGLTALPPNLDSVRGLACILLVAYHVVGSNATNGLHLPMNSPWHHAMESLGFVRMPIFTALSGYLYACRRPTAATAGMFMAKKLRRLAIPLLVLTLLTWAMRAFTLDAFTPLPTALLYGYQHLWFLQALLLLFAALALWDSIRPPQVAELMLAAAACAMLRTVAVIPPVFSLDGAVYLAPFFLFGMALRLRPALWLHPDARVLGPGLAAIVLLAQQAGLFGKAVLIDRIDVAATICGMAAVVAILRLVPPVGTLSAIGRYSFTIYLWHVIANAGARTLLHAAGVHAPAILFALGVATGLAAPILLHRAVSVAPWLAIPLTGTVRRRARPSDTPP